MNKINNEDFIYNIYFKVVVLYVTFFFLTHIVLVMLPYLYVTIFYKFDES